VDAISGAEYFNFTDQRTLACASLTNLTNSINLGVGVAIVHTTKANDLIIGSADTNTVVYDANLGSYSIDISAADNAVVADTQPNRDGVDSVLNIERLQFTDTMLALDTGATQNAGNAYLLYQAAFNRTPDTPGLGYWIAQMDKGANVVTDVAQNFILSNEFKTLYGPNPTVTQFVNLLYQNVLHRAPDIPGLNYWLSEFATQGDSLAHRAVTLDNFAISAENVANVTPQIAHGISYQAYGG
jgi:hypothetical protein